MYKVIMQRTNVCQTWDKNVCRLGSAWDGGRGRLRQRQACVEAFEQYHPEIVITDIKMPIMDWNGADPKNPGKNKRRGLLF